MTSSPSESERLLPFSDLTPRGFVAIIAALCIFYLGIEVLYISRFPLVMDEFVGAQAALAYATKIPYVDFVPHKTILGYYIQALAINLSADSWRDMLLVKFEMALLTALGLAFSTKALDRLFRRNSLVLALALTIVMSTFLERSAELRVDMLTGLFGLFALVALLRERYGWSGVLCALSVLASQKGAYFVLASWAGLGLCAVRYRSKQSVRNLLWFSTTSAVLFGGYLLAWTILSSPAEVVQSTFLRSRGLAFNDYPGLHAMYWSQTLIRNPLFWALGALSLGLLTVRFGRTGREATLFGYGIAFTALAIWHKQPWPYFFVIVIPVFFVLLAWLFDQPESRTLFARHRHSVVAILVLIGFALPLSRLLATGKRDQGFQHEMYRIADHILPKTDTYLAGVPILYRRSQAVADAFNSLDGLELAKMRSMPPNEIRHLVARLDASPTKICIWNYRLQSLPLMIREYISSQYAPFWGNILIYSPKIAPGCFRLRFAGTYLVVPRTPGTEASIDGRKVRSGDRIELAVGEHRLASNDLFRLTFVPKSTLPLDPRYEASRPLFPNVYRF